MDSNLYTYETLTVKRVSPTYQRPKTLPSSNRSSGEENEQKLTESYTAYIQTHMRTRTHGRTHVHAHIHTGSSPVLTALEEDEVDNTKENQRRQKSKGYPLPEHLEQYKNSKRVTKHC